MTVRIDRIEPDRIGDRDVLDMAALYDAANAVDRPGWPSESPEAMAGRLRTSHLGPDPLTWWLCRLADGRAAGFGVVQLPQEENTAMALVEVRVHPELRRRGFGTQLLRVLIQQAQEAGRIRLLGTNLVQGGAGEPWVERMGFEPAHGFIVQALSVAQTDPALWQVPPAPGYRLREWTGSAPEELLESYATARQAITDSPWGEMTLEHPSWTPQRVRDEEKAVAERGAEDRVVVAVHEATGAVAGFTELFVYARQPRLGRQSDTAVLAEHRGRGLGRAMKGSMMRRLVRELPEVERVLTQTAVDNVWMAEVNHRLGYRTLWTQFYVEAELATVRERCGEA